MNLSIKTLAATAALAGLAAVAGCSVGQADTTPEPVQNVAAAPATVHDTTADLTSTQRDNAYVGALVGDDPQFGQVDTSTLIDLGHSICGGLDDGLKVKTIAAIAVGYGFTDFQAGEVIGAAIGAICPSHVDAIREFTNEALGGAAL